MSVATQPPQEATRLQRIAAPVAAYGGLGAAVLALHLRDPNASGSWGFCPSQLAGFDCPGCGSLRAVHALTDGDLGAALSSNLVLVLVMPLLVALLARWGIDRWRGTERPRMSRERLVLLGWAVLPALAVFTVLRNLPVPWGLWLAS